LKKIFEERFAAEAIDNHSVTNPPLIDILELLSIVTSEFCFEITSMDSIVWA